MMTAKQVYDALIAAHEKEAEDHGAAMRNFGWVIDLNGIISKTSKGRLETTLRQGVYFHKWTRTVRA